MYDVKPFVPKIYVEYPDKITSYNTLEEYEQTLLRFSRSFYRHTSQKHTTGTPYYVCTVCGIKHIKLKNYNPKCFVTRKVIDPEATKKASNFHWNYYQYKTVVVENTHGHNITPVVVLRNELGDPIDPSCVQKSSNNFNIYAFKRWMEGDNSPNLRGLLPSERNRIEAETDPRYGWNHNYRHAISNRPFNSYCRQIKTFNERKQYAKCKVDEYSPTIRGRRSISSLPNNWDDYFPHYDKSWKNKKIRKQWMINIK